jgi:putative NADH-flavin reductase
MRVIVFGAAGPMGRLLVAGATGRGHEAAAFAGDPLDGAAVAAAVRGCDAVLYAVEPPAGRRRDGAASRGILPVVRAMARHDVRRLVCLSGSGARPGRDPEESWLRSRLIRPLSLGRDSHDLRHMEVTVRQSGLDWTLVRPARLVDAPGKHSWRAGPGYSLPHGTRIARSDVAEFMLDQLETGENVGHAVAVAW